MDPTEILRCAADLGEGGEHARAAVLLERALEAHPNNAPLHTARGWALENLGSTRWAEARIAYECAIALDANELWAQVGLATVLGQIGESALCQPIYRDLAERAGVRAAQEPEYLELLGWCQYRLGRLAEAGATFTCALAIDDAWVSVRFDLGLVLLLSGDAHTAARHYGNALCTLANRGLNLRTGPVKVALDDLDEAVLAHPGATAAAAPLRQRLLDALQSSQPSLQVD
jgi:tetratricopeptide (TPR) repeat protein